MKETSIFIPLITISLHCVSYFLKFYMVSSSVVVCDEKLTKALPVTDEQKYCI